MIWSPNATQGGATLVQGCPERLWGPHPWRCSEATLDGALSSLV